MLMRLVTASLLLTTVIALESARVGRDGVDPLNKQLDDRNDTIGEWNPLDQKPAASMKLEWTQKDQQKRRQKRQMFNFRKFPLRKWPMPIVYNYDGTQDEDAKLMIEAAIKHWESETCIRFKRVDPDTKVTQQHIVFTAKLKLCKSYTGRIAQSISFPQEINLDSYACTHKLGVVVHEIGHTIGFWHEHVRPDRDNYVTVNNSKIYSWDMKNYAKLNTSVIDTVNAVPYDYGSVMHYSATEMSMMGTLRALKPINPLYLMTMGQRVGLSFFDAKLANLIYCKDKCANVTPFVRCYNRGYQDPNDCSKCKCPEGFGERECRDPAPVHGGCSPTSSGVIIVDSTTEHCVSSRNYNQADGKGTFRRGDKCNWLLQASVGRRIMVRFAGPRFSTFCYDSGPSCYQWVEIKYKNDLALRGPRFCCNPGYIPKFDGKSTLTSESNRMMVIFNAEYPLFTNKYSTDVPSHYMMGFKLCYKIAPILN